QRFLGEARTGSPEPVHVLKAHEDEPGSPTRYSRTVSDVARSRDGKRLVSGGCDHTVRVWSMDDPRHPPAFRGHDRARSRVAFGAGDRWIASSSTDRQVIIWDAQTYQEVARLAHGSAVYGIDFTPDGTRLACGCADSTIRIWDMATFQQVAELKGHTDYAHA